MKSARFKMGIPAMIALALLVACSSDPNKQKIKYLASGDRYFKDAKYQEAVIEFRNAIEVDPRFAPAHYQLGRAYLALRNGNAAFREITEAVTLDPSNADAQVDLAALLLARRQLDQAQTLAEKIIAIQPGNARAHAILADKFTLTHDYPKAIQEFQKVIELEPLRVENYSALAATFAAQGKTSEAENTYKLAAEKNPKSSQAHISFAEFYFSQRRMIEAETEMRAACGLDAKSVQPRLFLARIYLAENKSAEAEKLYEDLKNIAPKDPLAYRALGNYYASSGLREKAVAEFRAVLSAHSKDTEVKSQLVETLLDLNRVGEAAPLNQEVLAASASDAKGLLSQGRILISQGQYDKAKTALDGAVKANPNSPVAHYFLGLAQQSAGFPDLAKASFSRALELQPQMALASAALASLTVRSGNHEEALHLAENARQADPGLAPAYFAGAQALMAKGDLKQAEAQLLETLRRDPVSLQALATLLNLYIREDRGQEALQRVQGLVQQYPQNASLHFLEGLAYYGLKDLDKSEACVRKAISMDPQTPDAYTVLANIHLARGSVEEAKRDLRAAIAAHPRSLLNYMALATQYEKEGNWDEAKKLFEKAHEIDSTSPMVAAELAFLYLEHGGDVNAAVALAQVAKQKLPDSPVTADALGWAYYKLGSFSSALTQLKQSSEKVPNNPIYHYHLGMAYMADRQLDLARQSLRVALRTDPQFPYAANAKAALEQMSKGAH